MTKNKFLIPVLVCLVVVAYFFPQKDFAPSLPSSPSIPASDLVAKNFLIINNTSINIETADTNAERVLGLSGRQSLEQNSGFFFIWPKPQNVGIWMKDMNFSIDIVWIDAQNKIIDIKQGVSPDTFPTVFYPPAPALYVLELNAGFTKKNRIRVGDTIVL